MTTNNNINQGAVTGFAYSVTPELNDSLARGAIYQADLLNTGQTQGNAIGVVTVAGPNTGYTNITTQTYPLASPQNGPLLRQIQGNDGFRYMLARYDGVFAPDGTSPTPVQGAYIKAFSGTVTPNAPKLTLTIPNYGSASTAVFVSSGINDSYTLTGSAGINNVIINTFGGFVTGTQGTPATGLANNVYDAGNWVVIGPANFVNGTYVSPGYPNPLTIQVGDYYWLKLVVGLEPTDDLVSRTAATSKTK